MQEYVESVVFGQFNYIITKKVGTKYLKLQGKFVPAWNCKKTSVS